MHIAIPEEYFAGRKHKHDCTQSMIIEESEADSAKCEIFKNGSLVEKRACSESAYLKRLEEEACKLAESGDFQAAAERFQRLCAADGATPRHFEMKAQIHMELGEYWEAIKASTRSVELDGEWVDGYVTLARAQRNYGQLGLSEETFEKALSLIKEEEEKKGIREELEEVRGLHAEQERRLNIVCDQCHMVKRYCTCVTTHQERMCSSGHGECPCNCKKTEQ